MKLFCNGLWALGVWAAVCLWGCPRAQAGQDSSSQDIGSLNIKNMTLREVASLLSRGAGQQVIVSQAAGDISVSVYLANISAEDALAAICNAYRCWYKRSESTGIISVVTIEEYQSGLALEGDEQVKVVNLRYLDARQMGDTLRRLYRDRVIWERPDDDESDKLDDLERAIDRMDMLSDNAQLSDSQNNSNSRDSSSRNSSSRDRRSSRSGGSSEDLEEVQTPFVESTALLSQLQQARATGELGAFKQPGVVYLSVYRDTNDLVIRSADHATMSAILQTIEQMDKAKAQALIEVKVLEIELDDEDSRGVDWLFQSGDVSGGRSTGILPPFGGSADSYGTILAPDSNLLPQGSGLDPTAGLLQVASDHILARLQLLEDQNRLTGLATPNLCVADGEVSKVFVGAETTVLTGLDIEPGYVSDGTVISAELDPETDRRNVGMTLLITPQIHSGKNVTIRIVQEDSQLGSMQEIQYGTNEKFRSQDVESRSVATTVVANDGEISAVGGLIRQRRSKRDSGIPIMKDIPYLGWLFKSQSTVEKRTELVVLLRPYILRAPDNTQLAAQKMLAPLSEHPQLHGDDFALRIGHGELGSPGKNELEELREQAVPWETE